MPSKSSHSLTAAGTSHDMTSSSSSTPSSMPVAKLPYLTSASIPRHSSSSSSYNPASTAAVVSSGGPPMLQPLDFGSGNSSSSMRRSMLDVLERPHHREGDCIAITIGTGSLSLPASFSPEHNSSPTAMAPSASGIAAASGLSRENEYPSKKKKENEVKVVELAGDGTEKSKGRPREGGQSDDDLVKRWGSRELFMKAHGLMADSQADNESADRILDNYRYWENLFEASTNT